MSALCRVHVRRMTELHEYPRKVLPLHRIGFVQVFNLWVPKNYFTGVDILREEVPFGKGIFEVLQGRISGFLVGKFKNIKIL